MNNYEAYQVFYPGQYTDEEAETLGKLQEELKNPQTAPSHIAQDKQVTLEDML